MPFYCVTYTAIYFNRSFGRLLAPFEYLFTKWITLYWFFSKLSFTLHYSHRPAHIKRIRIWKCYFNSMPLNNSLPFLELNGSLAETFFPASFISMSITTLRAYIFSSYTFPFDTVNLYRVVNRHLPGIVHIVIGQPFSSSFHMDDRQYPISAVSSLFCFFTSYDRRSTSLFTQ